MYTTESEKKKLYEIRCKKKYFSFLFHKHHTPVHLLLYFKCQIVTTEQQQQKLHV